MSRVTELFKSHIFNTYNRQKISFVSGKGATLKGSDGKTYIDFFAGLAVNNLGYSHPVANKAVLKALKKPWHSTNLFEIPSQAELGALIQKHSFKGKTYFCNSGAEANEAAYKLAIKYGKSIHPEKIRVLAARDSFHGRTMGALALTGQPKYQNAFAPFVGNVDFFEWNNLDSLRLLMSDKVAALFIEPIQGESGVRPASAEFLREARKLCDQHKALLIFDEVQTGCARTGKLFAFQYGSVVPDVFTLAKGLGGGLPIGAMTAREVFAGHLIPGDHASTFGGNPFVTTVAVDIFKLYASASFLKKVTSTGKIFTEKLNELKKRFPSIKECRGLGLMLAIEFEAETVSTDKVRDLSLASGLLVNSIHNKILRLVPPLVISRKEIDKGFAILQKAIAKASQNGKG